MKLQALYQTHNTVMFLSDDIRQRPREPDTRSGDKGSWIHCVTLLTPNEEPWGGDTFHFVDFASSAHTLSRNLFNRADIQVSVLIQTATH